MTLTSELPEGVNRCDVACPMIAMINYEHQRTAELSGPLGVLASAVVTGVKGASVMARSWTTCPSRDLMHGTWVPSDYCKEQAQDIARRLRPISADSLTEHHQRILPLAGIYPDA